MKEIYNIIDFYDKQKADSSVKLALATVVRVEGSSYRRTGARMLVTENGVWVGGISGGCLEGDALKRARIAIFKEKPSINTYDTTKGDDHQIGVGLGCNGIIEVLFVPIDYKNSLNPVEILRELTLKRDKKSIFINVIKTNQSGIELGKIIKFTNPKELDLFNNLTDIKNLETTINALDKSQSIVIDAENHLFVEIVPPDIHVYLFGNQYDIYPLIRFIEEMGWRYTIVSESIKIKPELKHKTKPIEQLNISDFNENSALILMSHSLKTDKENLNYVLTSNTRYIGMLGPKTRFEKIVEELLQEGKSVNDKDFKRIFAPIGLDIGAKSPEQIALSIIAEINAVFTDRTGQNLRNRKEPINNRDQPMYFI